MKYRYCSLLLVMVLVGCSPSESAIQTAISMTQAASPTNTAVPTITPISDEILDNTGSWMRLIPAGEFMMGSEQGLEHEKPTHKVYLDAYYIDKYEVANTFYAVCVNAGVCQLPKKLSSATHSDYYQNPEFKLYPVIYVDFNMAKTYCEWRGAKLPTEAQWEKAARGMDGRAYPWGEIISSTVANYNSFIGDTTRIDAYEQGNSPYGVYAMAGNVWEWVADWYSESYYQISPIENPFGPNESDYRILRGGSWQNIDFFVRTSFRTYVVPTHAFYNVGIRCAKNFTP